MPDVQLTITLHEQGGVDVSGPISNPILCYGLLEMGRDALKEFWAKQAADGPRIVPAPPGVRIVKPNGS
jgi:hypothetical protein